MIIIIRTFVISFLSFVFITGVEAGPSHQVNKKFYADRYKFVQEYIELLKKYRKKKGKVYGSLAETIDGSMYFAFDQSQNQSDQKALRACKDNKGKKCKIRFQSLSINKKYNRYAVHDPQKQILEGSDYILKAGYIGNFRGVTFLSSLQDLNSKDFACSTDKEKDRGIVNIFSNELKKYPLDFLKNSGLKFIVVCNTLKLNDTEPFGIAPAHYDKSPGVFFVSSKQIKLAIKNKRLKIAKHVFHHEFYHIIDSQLTLNVLDEKWTKINKHSYTYDLQPSNFKLLNDKKGFITNYAMNNEFEDKAELFANLINDYDAVKKRIKDDPILFKKTRLLIERLKKISPEINKSFWDRLS